MLHAAERFRALTDGAFDPAIEPLMRAWGFHARRTSPPTSTELAGGARGGAGGRASSLEPGDRRPSRSAAAQLDLGGIGVGYGLDRMAAVLRGAGIRRAFLDVSGDCLAIGAPPGEPGWLVEIADPARASGR